MKGLDDVVREFVQLFESKGIPFALMGGLAVRIHAIPRPTYDVDFTISLPRDGLPSFFQQVQALGYTVPEPQLNGWIDTVHDLPVVKVQFWIGSRALDIDVFLAETPYQAQLLTRRQRHQAEGLDAWFVTAEDLILLKLLAGRPKDRVDVDDVLFIQGDLDEDYLRHWAKTLGVLGALEESLRSRDAGG
jgi:hypothetical protein